MAMISLIVSVALVAFATSSADAFALVPCSRHASFISSSSSFRMTASIIDPRTFVEEEIDFDAPSERIMAVGNVQQASALTELSSRLFLEEEEFDADAPVLHHPIRSSSQHSNDRTDFDAPLYKQKQVGNLVLEGGEGRYHLDHDLDVADDECYMGKDMTFDECVDFDPIHHPLSP